MPRALRPFVRLPGLRHFTVVAHPTFSPSGGFARTTAGDAEAVSSSASSSSDESSNGIANAMGPLPGYKAVIPKRERRRSQLLVVVDKPGLTAGGASPDPTDKKHHWCVQGILAWCAGDAGFSGGDMHCCLSPFLLANRSP